MQACDPSYAWREPGRTMKACHRCKTVWEEPGQPGFNNTCSKCGISLHSCMNCVHHVATGSVRCLVEGAAAVQDPAGGNRCSHFEFASPASEAEASGEMAGEAIFGGTRGDGDPAAARKRWAELFGGD